MIRSGALEPEREGRAYTIIERQVNQLRRLVDDLLDLARINRGTIELRHEIVTLHDLIDSSVASIRSAIDDRGHRLELALPPEPLQLRADPVRLEQVLGNLLSNAVRYTEPGGRITVRAEIRGGEVVMSVEDTGAGLSQEALQRIFEPFERRPGAKSREGGLGIGLTITRRLVELHGGRIDVESEGLGRGSKFTIHLPAVSDGSDASRLASPSVRPGPRQRVLVVDDNVDAALMLGEMLEHHGQEARVVHDGAAALEESARYAPDVVLLDLGLPDVDGVEVGRRLRQRSGPKRPLLIALTGFGRSSDRQRTREAGFDHHLVKPVNVKSVLELLNQRA